MIDLARANAPKASFIVASVHSVAIPRCVAVTGIGEGLTYLGESSDDLNFSSLLARVEKALVPGGVLVFDVVESHPKKPLK